MIVHETLSSPSSIICQTECLSSLAMAFTQKRKGNTPFSTYSPLFHTLDNTYGFQPLHSRIPSKSTKGRGSGQLWIISRQTWHNLDRPGALNYVVALNIMWIYIADVSTDVQNQTYTLARDTTSLMNFSVVNESQRIDLTNIKTIHKS